MSDALAPYDTAAPDAYWMPSRDGGIHRLGPMPAPWAKVRGGTIKSITLSDKPRINRRWSREWAAQQSDKQFTSAVETDVRPVVVENLTVRDTHLAVNGKWLVTGPAGARLLGTTGRAAKKARGQDASVEELNAFFTQASQHPSELPLWQGDIAGLDFVIEARNLKNYFHFVRETFSVLALIADLDGFTGRIIIVAQDRDVPAFVLAHIAAIFPELRDKVDVHQAPATFERAIIAHYSDSSYFYQHEDKIDGLIPDHQALAKGEIGTNLMKLIILNSYPRSLQKLREVAHKRIEDQRFEHLPDRFWVSRRATPGHDRTIENEDEILALLEPYGFKKIYFEDYAPLTQVGLLRDADIMISYHGAGFTNMLYAGPQARIIELGTLQTARLRMDDFTGFANASQADYTVAVADFPDEFGDDIPPMRGAGIYPVRMSDAAVANLIALVKTL
ncbi:MAG: glycosyltransferase family 61 protein [Octadecabacter sp.]